MLNIDISRVQEYDRGMNRELAASELQNIHGLHTGWSSIKDRSRRESFFRRS
jgi:hypothetical protein